MHSCFCFPQMSSIIEFHSLLLHGSSYTIFSVFIFPRAEVTWVYPVHSHLAKCFTMFAKKIVTPWHCSPTGNGCNLFLRALIWSDNRLISIFCLATVSTDIARLAANSASDPPFATVWVAAAAMLSKYPSSKSSIWFVSWGVPSIYLFSCVFLVPLQTELSPQTVFLLPLFQLTLIS